MVTKFGSIIFDLYELIYIVEILHVD